MAAPLFKVEVAFASGPKDIPGAWSDISAYVRRDPPLTYSRGSADEVPQLQAGRMTFAVDNSDGKFTPGSATALATWGAELRIRRQVRLSIWNGSAYVVQWGGVVDDWGTGWVNGVQGRTMVTCSDRIAAAGRIVLRSMVEQEILYFLPTCYFTLAEPSTATSWLDSYGGTNPYTLTATGTTGAGTGTITPGTGTGPGYDGLTATVFAPTSATNGKYLTGAFSPKTLCTAQAGAISAFVNTSTSAVQTVVVVGNPGPGGVGAGLSVSATGKLTGTLNTGAATTTLTSAANVATGATRHVELAWSTAASTTTLTLYMDGANVGSTTLAAGSATPITSIAIGGSPNTAAVLTGTVSHVFAYLSDPTATLVARVANAGLNGATGATTASRWFALCRYFYGSGTYSVSGGLSTMGPQPLTGQTLASALQQVLQAEQGYAFCDKDGYLAFKGRDIRRSVTSSLTLAPASIGQDLEFINNDSYLVNDVEVTRYQGATFTAFNPTSQAEYFPASESITINVDTDDQAQQLANWKVYVYGTPQTRARQFTIDAWSKQSVVTPTQVLALDIGTRVTLSPLTGPAPASSIDLFIEGLTGTIGTGWTVTYNTSPLGQSGSVMILDDATYGRLDSGGVLAF